MTGTGSIRRPLILVAHGTRDPDGPRVLDTLAAQVRRRLPDVAVDLAYVDVIGPTLTEVLSGRTEDAVIVPLFLASGYHVRVDIPAVVRDAGARALVTDALGVDPAVVSAVADRVREAGLRPGDAVVLAAAGSSDPAALAEVRLAAESLAHTLGVAVTVGYAATAVPTVHDAVAAARDAAPDGRVAIASYLLAPGLFQRRLDEAGGDVVAGPIGAHQQIVDLVVSRYQRALADIDAGRPT